MRILKINAGPFLLEGGAAMGIGDGSPHGEVEA